MKYTKAMLFIWCSMMLQPVQAMEKQEALSVYVTNNTNADLEIFTKPGLHKIKPYRTKLIGQANKLGIVTAQSKGLRGTYSLRLNVDSKKSGMQLITVSWHAGIIGGTLSQESVYKPAIDNVKPTNVTIRNNTNNPLKLEYIVGNRTHTVDIKPLSYKFLDVKLDQLEDIFIVGGPSLFEDLMEFKRESKDKPENLSAYFSISTYDGSIKVTRLWSISNQ